MGRQLSHMFTVFLVCVVVCYIFPGVATGQTSWGVIRGTVVDSTKAAIAGATLTLVSEATGDKRTITTEASGDFVFPGVLPGRYNLSIEAKGFKRFELKDVALTADERLAIGETVLEVGAVTESVTVTSQGTPVQTASVERAGTLTTDQMEGIQSQGRNVLSMLTLLPGVVFAGHDGMTNPAYLPNVNGINAFQMSVMMDGMPTNDVGYAGWGNTTNMDAVSEVKVLLGNYQAEYGRNSGSMVITVGKGGTQSFHGSGSLYKRHEQYNANNFFNNRNSVTKPRNRSTIGGFTIGGPVYWPGKFNSNKSKLFFFFAKEFRPAATPTALYQYTVPTDLERIGDFSKSLDVSGQLRVVKDPLNGQPFANNVVPKGRIDANGQAMLNILPLPNQLDRSLTKGAYNWTFQDTLPNAFNENVFRVDYNITDNIRSYARGAWRDQDAQGYATPYFIKKHHYNSLNQLAYHITQTLSPTLVNELMVGVHHTTEIDQAVDDADTWKLSRSKVGITLGQFHPEINPYGLPPFMSFSDVPSAFPFSFDNRWPLRGSEFVFNVSNGLSKIWRAHTFKAGIYIERGRDYEGTGYGGSLFSGSLDFGRNTSNPLDSNYGYGNAILGNFNSYQESTTRPVYDGRTTMIDWYLQDTWNITKRLVLDVGLRFSWFEPWYSHTNLSAVFFPKNWDPNKAPTLYRPILDSTGKRVAVNPLNGQLAPVAVIGALVNGSGDPFNGIVTQGTSGYPRSWRGSQLHPAPRLGLAYDPFGDGKTAIRAGFGIYIGEKNEIDIPQNPPIMATPTIYYGSLSTLLSQAGVLFPTSVSGLDKGNTITNYNLSFDIQRDVGFKTVVDVGYVGNLGRHLKQSQELNPIPYGAQFQTQYRDTTTGQPLPNNFIRAMQGYAGVSYASYSTSSNYHSLQTQVNRRFAHGIQFGVAWVWSKALDYGTSTPAYLNLRMWNYGKNSGMDRTHNVTANWLWALPNATKLVNHPVVHWAFDNWELSGVTIFQSGSPLGVGFSTTDGANLLGGGDGGRIIATGNAVLPKSDQTFYRFFDTSVFQRPPVGNIGNVPKDVIRGPGWNNWNTTISKSFRIKERASLRFRMEMYNTFNHTSFSGVDTNARFDPTGKQVSTSFGMLTSAQDPRIMQVSLKLNF